MSAEAPWVERLTAGSEHRDAALAELRRVLSRQLTKAFRDVGADFIEDMVQDALLKILANIHKFDSRSKFTTWAMTIAVRTGYTELRRRRWKDVSLDQVIERRGGDIAESIDSQHEPHSALERRGMIEDLYVVINEKLTANQRRALLAELGGMPQEEIGRRMGSNRNAVYKLTHDARKRLKRELESLGYSREDLASLRGES